VRLPTVAVLLAAVATTALVAVVFAQAPGIEFNVVSVVVPGELLGSFQTYIVPLNVSSTSLLSEANVYVVTQRVSRISYLFSRNPPIVVFAEPSAYSGSYEVWYGGENPYSSMIGAPGTATSIWLAYDDFDYSTGFWVNKTVSIAGSRAYVASKGYLALSQPYSSKAAHLWVLHGRRALVVVLAKPHNELVYLYFTPANFTDISSVRDGSDIFFVDSSGRCLYYSVLHLEPASSVHVAVNPEGNAVIYMLYGGLNACQEYRVG